jgi:hypothetical protein
MFELSTGVYAEKPDSGRYVIFTEGLGIRVYININSFIEPRLRARFLSSIARQLCSLQKKNSTANIERIRFDEE